MKNSVNFFDKTFPPEIYEQMVRASEAHNLTDTLVQMQIDRGIDREDAEKTAQVCIAAVASCEGIRDAISEDAMAVFDRFLEDMKTKPKEQRMLMLHKLYFGLTAHQDAEQMAEIERGISADELFWRYYDQQGKKPVQESETEMEEKIRQALKGFYLSPQAMKAMTRKMKITGAYLATAAALGENGANYKCIVAMDLYLNHSQSMTIHEAANMACVGVQTQAVADAVAKGFMSRELAKKILITAAIAAVVIGVGILLYHAGAAMMAAQTAAAMAEAANAHYVIELPAVFAEFATATTTTGAPGMQVFAVGAETIAGWVAALEKKALIGQVIGAVVAVSGAAMAVLSDRAAAVIGKFATMVHKDQASFVEEIDALADCVQDVQKTPAESDHLPEQEDSLQDFETAAFSCGV